MQESDAYRPKSAGYSWATAASADLLHSAAGDRRQATEYRWVAIEDRRQGIGARLWVMGDRRGCVLVSLSQAAALN